MLHASLEFQAHPTTNEGRRTSLRGDAHLLRETAAVYRGERLVGVLNIADVGTMDVSIRCDGINCNGPDFTLQANDQLATVRRSQMARSQKRLVARTVPDLP